MTSKENRLRALNEAINRGGGIVRFAKAMGVTHQAVTAWRRRGFAPADRALAIEAIFGVPREDVMAPHLVDALYAPSALAAGVL